MKETFGQRLKTVRKQKGFNQTEFSKLLNIPRVTYGGYERDDRFPDYKTIIKLITTLNISADYLFGLSDIPRKITTSEVSISVKGLSEYQVEVIYYIIQTMKKSNTKI